MYLCFQGSREIQKNLGIIEWVTDNGFNICWIREL